MANHKLRAALVATAMTAGGAGVIGAASPAAAHDSGYCGHGADGLTYVTQYVREVTDRYSHAHLYHHWQIRWNGTTYNHHYVWKSCPRH
jgi:hypothetical protein